MQDKEKWKVQTGGFIIAVAFVVAALVAWQTFLPQPVAAPMHITPAATTAQKPNLTTQEIYYTPNPNAPLTISEHKAGAVYTYSGSIPSRATCETIASSLATTVAGDITHITLQVRLLYAGGTCSNASTSTPPQQFSLSYTAAAGVTPILSAVTVNEQAVPFEVVKK